MSSILVGLIFITLIQSIILSTTTEAEVLHSVPKNGLRKRQTPTKAPLRVKPFVPAYDWEQQEYVKAHNYLRNTLRMPPLQWDSNLSSYAHSWASERQNDCNYRHHSSGPYGESTFWMQYKEFNPGGVVKKWFSEQTLFDHKTNRCKCQPERDECECGHYLNVIWKTTKKVGCSSPVYCAHGKGLLVICNYYPPGNYLGENPLNPRH